MYVNLQLKVKMSISRRILTCKTFIFSPDFLHLYSKVQFIAYVICTFITNTDEVKKTSMTSSPDFKSTLLPLK